MAHEPATNRQDKNHVAEHGDDGRSVLALERLAALLGRLAAREHHELETQKLNSALPGQTPMALDEEAEA